MNDQRPATMIEDYTPVEEISYESSREKVARRRNGHLSTLHLWWARRPLAASRAAVYATFAPPAVGEARAGLAKFFTNLSSSRRRRPRRRPSQRGSSIRLASAHEAKRPARFRAHL